MLLYLDTSVVVAAITREAHTERAHEILAGVANLVISDWTVTEVSAALSLKQRLGGLPETDRHAALALFQQLAEDSMVREHIGPADFLRAAQLADRPGVAVRAGDALHLAVVERVGATLASFDTAMSRAAAELGLSVLE